MAIELADAVAPGLALAGVVVGLAVTGRREERRWLRDRRADAYAAVLTTAADTEPIIGALHGDMVMEATRPLRQACDRAGLFAGREVSWLLDDLMAEAYGVARDDLPGSGFVNRLGSLQAAMRDEVNRTTWRQEMTRRMSLLRRRQPAC